MCVHLRPTLSRYMYLESKQIDQYFTNFLSQRNVGHNSNDQYYGGQYFLIKSKRPSCHQSIYSNYLNSRVRHKGSQCGNFCKALKYPPPSQNVHLTLDTVTHSFSNSIYCHWHIDQTNTFKIMELIAGNLLQGSRGCDPTEMIQRVKECILPYFSCLHTS